MFFEMMCSCSASLQIDVDGPREDAAWLLLTRFSEAHVDCGYVTQLVKEKPEITKRFNLNVTPDQDI